jgi:S-adenosylmethionine:tRNA ribosyltransferase-isomerase
LLIMKIMDLKEYDYDLPEEKIAQYPLAERDMSKLLIYKNGEISQSSFRSIHHYLPERSLMLFNDTKVIRARLKFTKESGAKIEIFCLGPSVPADYALSLNSKNPVEWKCLIGNSKKWNRGTIITTFTKDGKQFKLQAEKISPEGDAWIIRFSWNSGDLSFGEVIETAGHIPLPPYLNRDDEPRDSVNYQTIYSHVKGSVAAPTAGLHFTRDVFDKLLSKEIETAKITLHVGAGTFQPVKTDNILEHQMHSEHFYVGSETIGMILKNIGSVIAVGTTSVRTIESLYWIGNKLKVNPMISPDELYLDQWEAYSMKNSLKPWQSLETILEWMQRNRLKFLHAPTRIIIIPGYDFKITGGIITNFHLPKSTLLLLVSAWVGNDWKKIYKYALENNFRFLSYGDSSLLSR